MSVVQEDILATLFTEARTHNVWRDQAVDDDLLRSLYDTAKWGPTAANSQPLRVVFVKSPQAKEKLRPVLSAGNVEKTMLAPATAIMAYDSEFYNWMPKLFPSRPEFKDYMASLPRDVQERSALVSATLQSGYFIVAARALGLDCGPMGGFDNAKLDTTFFPDGKWKSILLVNLGYGDHDQLFPRNPRLDFDEACRIE